MTFIETDEDLLIPMGRIKSISKEGILLTVDGAEHSVSKPRIGAIVKADPGYEVLVTDSYLLAKEFSFSRQPVIAWHIAGLVPEPITAMAILDDYPWILCPGGNVIREGEENAGTLKEWEDGARAEWEEGRAQREIEARECGLLRGTSAK